jgi:hypothetical protein
MEGTSPAHLTLDPQTSSHELDQLLANGEPQASPAVATRRGTTDLDKGFKDGLLPVRRDADAGVTHRKMQDGGLIVRVLLRRVLRHLVDLDNDLAVFGKFDGVAHQIGEDLAQAIGVADHMIRHFSMDHMGQFKPLLMGL